MRSQGYTLWLMPGGREYTRFADLIRKLAKENKAPVFQPHVTLLGEILLEETEAIDKTRQLVLNQKPFIIFLQQIDYEDYYFRSLFIRTKMTDPLLLLHNRAKELFQIQIPPYMPHLSLLYGNFPQEIKDQIIKEIGKDQSDQFKINSIHLVKGGGVKDWKIIEEFFLD